MAIAKIGFVVNPIAGMGGKVGLKGTDGVLEKAKAEGAQPVAPQRAIEFLRRLLETSCGLSIDLVTCPGKMGAEEAEKAGFHPQVLPMKIGRKTSALDTENVVKLLLDEKVDLIVFVGGDGTARNVLDAIGADVVPVLGVPSGVKMYSGIFAVSPQDAAQAIVAFVEHRAELVDFEIMDADEEAIRNDVFSIRLYGFLKGIYVPLLMQGSKQVSPDTVGERENQNEIARFIIEEMPPEGTFLLGPGTTIERIAESLGVKKTVLGVDIYRNGKIINDVNEKTILREIKDWKNTWLILSPIGHQGILLGRGNQQVSPEIIKRMGRKHIVVAATRSKLENIEGRTLRVDTGNPEIDDMLRGPLRVITDYKEGVLLQVQ